MALATVVAVLSSVAVALVLRSDPASTTVVAGSAADSTATPAALAPVSVPNGVGAQDLSHVRLPRADDTGTTSDAPVTTDPLYAAAPTSTTTTITPTVDTEAVTAQPEQC